MEKEFIMRNPNRLKPIYEHLKELHTKHCLGYTVMTFVNAFFEWYGKDPFYVEDDQVISLFDEFVTTGHDKLISWSNSVITQTPEEVNMAYDYLCSMHEQTFPDWRFFPLMYNFLAELHEPLDSYDTARLCGVFGQFASRG